MRERWEGGEREVQWARWKIMWKNARDNGIIASDMAIDEIFQMLPVTSPSSILAKRLRLWR